jgi:hypothetical protein
MVMMWVVLVQDYGVYLCEGSEDDVEQQRIQKSQWHRRASLKRRATPEEILAQRPFPCWNHPGFNNQSVLTCTCGRCHA